VAPLPPIRVRRDGSSEGCALDSQRLGQRGPDDKRIQSAAARHSLPGKRLERDRTTLRGLAVPSLIAIACCYTPLFLRSAEIRRESGQELIPLPVYGPLFPVFGALLASSVIILIIFYVRDLRRSTGVQKVELQFIVAGGVALAIL